MVNRVTCGSLLGTRCVPAICVNGDGRGARQRRERAKTLTKREEPKLLARRARTRRGEDGGSHREALHVRRRLEGREKPPPGRGGGVLRSQCTKSRPKWQSAR
jgi:hypothetical protein